MANTLYKPLIYEIIPGTEGTASGTTSTTSIGDGSGVTYSPPTEETEVVLLVPVTETAFYPGYGYGSTGIVTYEPVIVTVPASGGGRQSSPLLQDGSGGGYGEVSSPPEPPTPAQVNTYFDRQWNSLADTISAVAPGDYIECRIQYGSYAVFVGLDAVGETSTLPSAYRYGIMADVSGVRIFENGVSGALLAVNTPTTTLRIHRSVTGQVYYQVVGQSLVPSPQAPIAPSEVTQGYGLLYSSLDAILDTEVASATIADPSLPITMETGLTVMTPPRVVMASTFDLAIGLAPAALMPVQMDLEATPTPVKTGDVTIAMTTGLDIFPSGGGSGTWNLPAFQMLGTETGVAYGQGSWTLPRFTMTGVEQTYVPADPDEGFWILPRWAMWGQGLDEDHGSGNWSLRPFAMIGAEEGVEYGQGDWTLSLQFEMISYPPWWPDGTFMMVSGLAVDSQTPNLFTDLVLVLNSAGALTGTLALTRAQLLSLMSSLASSGSLTLSGVYGLTLLGNLSAGSLQALRALAGADLPENAAVWVVNMDTQASAQYDDYGFNSFFRRGNDYYGVANDGIYKLSGTTDAGSPIDAFAAFVRTTLGIQSVKHVPTVYVGAASDGALVLRVDVDGVARYYKARTSSTPLNNHRVDIGRGARGVYWEFDLLNQNGDDFDVADITLLPVVRDRRI